MAITRYADYSIMDAALDKIITAIKLRVCSGTNNPISRAEAISTTLAEVDLDTGDFSKANGDVSGRKVTLQQQANMSIDVSGDASCVTLDDGTTLLYVIPATVQPLTAGGFVTSPAFDIEFASPTAP